MNSHNSSRHDDDQTPPTGLHPPGSDRTGALVLALLAAGAFCGWYIFGRELPRDEKPPAVVATPPILPPAATDTSAELPGHHHYTAFVSKDQPGAPQTGAKSSKP
jgi:hypothetical protein